MTISEDRVLKGMYLREWTQQDEDVRMIVATICAKHGVGSYALLAEEHPDVFDDLYESMRDLLEESPSIGNLPGFMQ